MLSPLVEQEVDTAEVARLLTALAPDGSWKGADGREISRPDQGETERRGMPVRREDRTQRHLGEALRGRIRRTERLQIFQGIGKLNHTLIFRPYQGGSSTLPMKRIKPVPSS